MYQIMDLSFITYKIKTFHFKTYENQNDWKRKQQTSMLVFVFCDCSVTCGNVMIIVEWEKNKGTFYCTKCVTISLISY